MKCFPAIACFRQKDNKTPEANEPIRFEVKLSVLQHFVDSHTSKEDVSPNFSAAHMEELRTRLKYLTDNSTEIKWFWKNRLIVRFEKIRENEYPTLGIVRPDFWLSRRMQLRQGGFPCGLSMEVVKELEREIQKWKSSNKS
ncbi:hypothetical protein J4E83_003638 [Alternaria metachromatica]|uniref:uncharacterized protein n=1 Tax=Alternaria metachromatica TaxID=283354 RepID=UPI0020C36487|nr:uncharacterized protein J4E83_003638 [Alternaria metachromatica]KAI4626487.1 hypothetical protein J4E83_003638 [Alternaria metachromatica]